jgi:hypothetical protein
MILNDSMDAVSASDSQISKKSQTDTIAQKPSIHIRRPTTHKSINMLSRFGVFSLTVLHLCSILGGKIVVPVPMSSTGQRVSPVNVSERYLNNVTIANFFFFSQLN